VWLRQTALTTWAGEGELVTDDNQLLQWGQMRPAATSAATEERQNANLSSLAEAAGAMPFRVRFAQPTR
jgi:hypothetical protein